MRYQMQWQYSNSNRWQENCCPDQRNRFSIALGSLQECRALLELEKIENQQLDRIADELAAILYMLSRKTVLKSDSEV